MSLVWSIRNTIHAWLQKAIVTPSYSGLTNGNDGTRLEFLDRQEKRQHVTVLFQRCGGSFTEEDNRKETEGLVQNIVSITVK